MPSFTRRDFLASTSLAVVGAGLGVQALSAQALRSALPAAAYLPDPTPEETLRALASSAIDAARSAGAAYADIRVATRRALRMHLYDNMPLPISEISLDHSYGTRVMVNGAWAFGYGSVPTVDAVTGSARRAVADAKVYAAVSASAAEWAPAPIVSNGTWTSPAEIDPFTVPLPDQINLLGAFNNAAARVSGITTCEHTFDWIAETRVFASTEGTMITQRSIRAFPRSQMSWIVSNFASISLETPSFLPGTVGYETVLRPELQENIKATAEEVRRLSRLPQRQLDVGRYDVVFDGPALGALYGETINPAFEMDRVLGHDMDGGGSSFLAPPSDIVGTQLFSPVLSVRVEQSPLSLSYAKWDDDGVATGGFPVIQGGRVVDYYTTRSTAHGSPRGSSASRGCAIAGSPLRPPMGYAGQVAIAPGTQSGRTLDTLCREIKHGILVRDVWSVSADQSLLGAAVGHATLLEIQDGQIVARARGNSLYVRTQPSWKALTTLGDASTLGTYTRKTVYGQPWWAIAQNITAPAALVPEVAVTHLPRNI